jgi:hypothetical protein
MKGGLPGLNAHHTGVFTAMNKAVSNYDHETALTILFPKVEHAIDGPNGIVSGRRNGLYRKKTKGLSPEFSSKIRIQSCLCKNIADRLFG